MSDLITAKLQPYAVLSAALQLYIAENSEPQPFEAGQVIFEEGKPTEHIFYLLKGKVSLSRSNGKTVRRGPSALCISQGYDKYTLSCKAEEKSLVLRINLSPQQQDELLCWEIAARFYEQSDWITAIKDCGMFDNIPASNALKLIQSFKQKTANVDDIITQENHYEKEFYVLLSGKAGVYQGKIDKNSKCLSEILPLQTFGEAAFMDDLPRTASIKILEAGALMVFDTSKLDDLLAENIPESCYLNNIDLKQAVAQGAKILDIRPEQEARLSPLKTATLAPVDQVPESLDSLGDTERYVIYSPYHGLNKMVYTYLVEAHPEISIHKN